MPESETGAALSQGNDMQHATTIDLFIHAEKGMNGETIFKPFMCDMSQYGYTYLGIKKTVFVEFELDDNFDITAAEIKSLRDQQKKIQAESQRQVVEIEERIQSMLAIEYKTSEV